MTATTISPATCHFCSEKAAPAGQFCRSCEEKYYALRRKELNELGAKMKKAGAEAEARVRARYAAKRADPMKELAPLDDSPLCEECQARMESLMAAHEEMKGLV